MQKFLLIGGIVIFLLFILLASTVAYFVYFRHPLTECGNGTALLNGQCTSISIPPVREKDVNSNNRNDKGKEIGVGVASGVVVLITLLVILRIVIRSRDEVNQQTWLGATLWALVPSAKTR